jgi:transcriptional regulator GlxA family with amidase domain
VRSFRRSYGVAPHEYQTALRVALAARLLRAGVPPAAIDVGFCDQSHFARHFRRAYAVTPVAYQRAVMA